MQHSRPLSYYFRKLLSPTLLAVGLWQLCFCQALVWLPIPVPTVAQRWAGDRKMIGYVEFNEHQVPKGTGLSGHMQHSPAINRKEGGATRTAADLRPVTWVLDKTASRQPTWGIGGRRRRSTWKFARAADKAAAAAITWTQKTR